MPFKIKLKKSRHYNVTSKSLFVISVHHLLVLDTPTTVDCTLSSESTGLECLENVCQRLSINQPEFFGLRYIVKGSETEMRWVDLERPLSRQLEKHAANPKLYLRIMYYVISGVTLITDEVTRNYYFLQLKSDVVDGRIRCDPRQAVALAMYCRQAQYDSYQSERHTVDYLKTLLPFPKHMIEAGLLETLTEEVLQPNPEIQCLTQSAAEGLFITACQQLDGYGQERFNAKNDSSYMVSLGITVAGIVVTTLDGSYTFYPWHEISNVVNHKRIFNIECTDAQKSVGFTLQDADTGRYFWKLCVLQHTFFMKYEQNQVHPNVEQQANVNLFQNVPEDLNESRDNLFEQTSNIYASDSHIPASLLWNQSHQQLHPHQTESIVSSNMSLAASQQQLRNAYEHGCTPVPNEYAHRNSNWRLVGSNTSLNNGRTQSTSCLDLSNNNIQHERERERLKAFLPGYRPAPDYETAVQQKYRSNTHINSYSGSQPDVHQATAITDAIFGHQLQQKYPDVTQTTNPIYQQHFADPSLIGVDGLSHQLQMMRFNKPPPPPYHTNQRFSSTSTPDLASHQLLGYRGAYGSSPDLLSTRTFINQPPQFMSQQQVYPVSTTQSQTFRYRYAQGIVPHGTYENLNYIEGGPGKTNLLSQKLQNGYRNGSPLTNGPTTKPQHNGSIEPIYENIPLPWQSENNQSAEMRDRASSIQSAPGVMRFKTQPHLNQNYLNETAKATHPNAMKQQLYAEHALLSKSTSNPIEQQTKHHHNHHSHQQQQQQHNHHQLTSHHSNESTHEVDGRTNTGNGTVIAINSSSNSNLNSTFEPNVEIIQPPKQFQQATDKPVHKTRIEIIAANQNESMSTSNNNNNNNSNNHNNNNHHHHDISNRSNSLSKSNILETSQSSTFTNQTATTTDSGVSMEQKEKKKRRWGFFGGGGGNSNKSSSSADKQKSATLGREKDKDKNKGSKSKTIGRDEQSSLKHRWSTGLPKLQPLAATISKEKLSQLLEEKLHDSKMFMEFESIPKRKDGARYDCALHEENRNKNFDPNFLPYDENRVRVTPSVGNRLGYVNASNIQVTVGKKQRFYIVSQSPQDTQTLHLFWQCVWEADVYLIVQLSEEINYIPATAEKCLNYGQYQVFQEFTQNTGRCITSKFRLYHTQSRRYRSVWHLKYSNWAEQNCPLDVEHFLDFLKELNSVRLASINEVPPGHNTNPPVLIHCSEGGGRAGVTLCSDLLMYTLDHNQDLDIPRVVGQLRHQRDNIIPSLAQYKFIYSLLIHSLKQTRLI